MKVITEHITVKLIQTHSYQDYRSPKSSQASLVYLLHCTVSSGDVSSDQYIDFKAVAYVLYNGRLFIPNRVCGCSVMQSHPSQQPHPISALKQAGSVYSWG